MADNYYGDYKIVYGRSGAVYWPSTSSSSIYPHAYQKPLGYRELEKQAVERAAAARKLAEWEEYDQQD